MQLYAITDRRLFISVDTLLEQAILWAESSVDYVQIREKDLPANELAALASWIVRAVRSAGGHTRVLLNGPAEMAAATGCDGVHLPSDAQVEAVAAARAALRGTCADPVVSVSCHAAFEVERARKDGATLALFAPVFEKQIWEKRLGVERIPGQGLAALADACRAVAPMPVFALGGVTVENAGDCVRAGAAGVAAIRLFAAEAWRGLL